MKLAVIRVLGFTLVAACCLSFVVERLLPAVKETHHVRLTSALHDHIVQGRENPMLTGLTAEDVAMVKRSARDYGVDYRLVLAIIRQESMFNRDAVSERGATGLMQLMPVTDREMSEEMELGGERLPQQNIRTGTYYFAKLFGLFKRSGAHDRAALALAAYNAGPARVYDAQELAAYLGENPNTWTSIQNVLPLLSKRYYSLHKAVWVESRPRNGYFGSWRQTVQYVDNVMESYDSYRALLPEAAPPVAGPGHTSRLLARR